MTDPTLPPFFWLHVKKSAGQSTRRLLQPHYRVVDRSKRVQNFPDTSALEWNDVLNNYRVPLGAYQYRRCLYAREFLYKNDWSSMPRFAFSRDPLDRAISAFFYLEGPGRRGGLMNLLPAVPVAPLRQVTLSYAFDRYLTKIEEVRASDSYDLPHGLLFATHTAAMWPDITDTDGVLLLSHVFAVKDMTRGVRLIFDLCGLTPPTAASGARKNSNSRRMAFTPSRRQIARVEALYANDFALHHDRLHHFVD